MPAYRTSQLANVQPSRERHRRRNRAVGVLRGDRHAVATQRLGASASTARVIRRSDYQRGQPAPDIEYDASHCPSSKIVLLGLSRARRSSVTCSTRPRVPSSPPLPRARSSPSVCGEIRVLWHRSRSTPVRSRVPTVSGRAGSLTSAPSPAGRTPVASSGDSMCQDYLIFRWSIHDSTARSRLPAVDGATGCSPSSEREAGTADESRPCPSRGTRSASGQLWANTPRRNRDLA